MRKPAFCICENKDADQLRGNRKAHASSRGIIDGSLIEDISRHDV